MLDVDGLRPRPSSTGISRVGGVTEMTTAGSMGGASFVPSCATGDSSDDALALGSSLTTTAGASAVSAVEGSSTGGGGAPSEGACPSAASASPMAKRIERREKEKDNKTKRQGRKKVAGEKSNVRKRKWTGNRAWSRLLFPSFARPQSRVAAVPERRPLSLWLAPPPLDLLLPLVGLAQQEKPNGRFVPIRRF